MAGKFNTSTNIIRDQGKKLDYLVTANSQRVADDVCDAYMKGIHSFTLIGSYGTGKSSFLLAFEQSLRGNSILNVGIDVNPKRVETINIVGQYQSIIGHFQETLGVDRDFEGNQKVFDKLFEASEGLDLLVVFIDEFGKFLEYAAKHNPDKELYFLQQLAEFVNDHNRNILLITTLHQNFEAYSIGIADISKRKEWKKVKGRFKELTFNEPVEQLLLLAAQKLASTVKNQRSLAALVHEKHIVDIKGVNVKSIEGKLWPLDILSATILTRALQSYGQNERSLFTFLEADLGTDQWFGVAHVYDYLNHSFYSFLHSSYNPHYRHWQAMHAGLERIETFNDEDVATIQAIYKTIGLVQLFGSKGAAFDQEGIATYFKGFSTVKGISRALQTLESRKLVLFAKYAGTYKLIEGTDVDFDYELTRAEEGMDKNFDIPAILREHFHFPVIQAKEVSYKTGTPRLFEFRISTDVLGKLKPDGATDGFINLVFNDQLEIAQLEHDDSALPKALLVGYFTNSKQIEDRIFEILKTKKVLAANVDDLVAKQEFQKIINSHERLLSHEVIGALYSEKVRWFFNGREHTQIDSPKKLNKLLSNICGVCYPSTPMFKNELLNKHKISTSIHTARKNYFQHLASDWMREDFGFDESRFPPEKTIYQSLLLANQIHHENRGNWELGKPASTNSFDKIWDACSIYMQAARTEKKGIDGLWSLLKEAPFKLKQGLIDFWVPTFLFINRGDFALYEEDRFIPELNDSVMYLMTRQPQKYFIKSFEINDLRLRVFNKYREVLQQDEQRAISANNLVESIKPFLVFYKSLNQYAKQTKRLSSEAVALRNVISQAKDLEETFFNDIPKALKLDTELTKSSDALLSDFAVKLNDAIQELKLAYAQLLDRFEGFITNEVLAEKLTFSDYKIALASRFKALKEHKLLPKQKIFTARLSSPLNDRDSWLASVAQALLGKPLDQISDNEELLLYDRLAKMIRDLDNLNEVHRVKAKEGEEVYKLDITTVDGTKSQSICIPKGKRAQVQDVTEAVKALLSKHKGISLAVLSILVQEELDND